MDSVGVFRKGEIDGKPFHIFSFSSQTSSSSFSGEVATNLGGNHLYLESLQPPLFACPNLRYIYSSSKEFIPYYTPPQFSSNDDDDDDRCSKNPVLPIFWCNNKQPNSREFECGACHQLEMGTVYYLCLGCKKMFHKECVETPLRIQNHPSYPFLSFQLFYSLYNPVSCRNCKLHIFGMFYHSPTDKLSLHPVCATKSIPILVEHPKRHPHTLSFFPKQTSLLCDVCGLLNDCFPTYVCVQCVFVVHQDCIYLPFVIKISRHPHRISFTYSLPSGNWSCGVCRKKVDDHCGAYSCNKCSNYFVHSKCAVREDVWDGIELEGVPEEPEEVVEPFEKIADGIILHFTHGHNLKLEVSEVYNEHKFCQACILPIYKGNYYSCLDGCDFVLHETCASSPRKIHHPLHAHPLTLKAIPGNQYGRSYKGYFKCEACERLSCGFVYEKGDYKIDVRCASVSEPFEYQGHEHPLFLSLDPTEEEEATCRICRETDRRLRKVSCIECDYVICFKCATLPYEAMYKHDKHLLTFREGKEGNDVFDWCDKCERKIEYSSEDGFYECDFCCNTLHVDCLLGEDPYMLKPGQTIKEFGEYKDLCHILSNNTQSRPVCQGYNEDTHLCPQKVVFKFNDRTFCSYRCFISIFCD